MKRKLVLLLTAGTLVLSLVGCGDSSSEDNATDIGSVSEQAGSEVVETPQPTEEPEVMTAERLVEEMAAAAEGKQMLQVSVTMDMAMSIAAEGITMEMAMSSTADTKMSVDPYASYSNTSMTMDMAGQQTTVDSEVYMVVENDTVVSYLHEPTSGVWQRMDSGMSVDEAMMSYTGYDWMMEKSSEELILEEATQMVGGREAYVLSCILTGQEMQQALNGMSGMEDLMEESGLGVLDYTSLTVPTIYYIDAETYLPVQMDMEIEGMSEMMNSLFTDIVGEGEAEVDMGVDISNVHAVYTNISYEPVEVPAVPEEALAMAAQASINPDQGDGTYIIQETGAAVRVTCPEGWIASDMNYDRLMIERDDGSQMAVFTMYKEASSADFISYVEDVDVPDMQAEEMYVSHEAGPIIGVFETMKIECTGVNLLYAWAPMSDGWIFINMVDFNCLPVEDALTPLLNVVEEWK